MTARKVYQCIVDDTALITNINEIETWVADGAVTLVIPLYTLERLRFLKKDSSQLGMNARKAVKFLDRATSDTTAQETVILQGPDEQYPSWAEVEAHYANHGMLALSDDNIAVGTETNQPSAEETDLTDKRKSNRVSTGPLSQALLEKLNFTDTTEEKSPISTPPMSPASTEPHSSKTSPEVSNATVILQDRIPVPPSLKQLFNSVVWYMNEKSHQMQDHVVFLTNSADTAHLGRDFKIPTKNIHQLRNVINIEEAESKNQDRYQKKHLGSSPKQGSGSEPQTLFSYEDHDSEDEEVIFKPRARGAGKAPNSGRAAPNSSNRHKSGSKRSPRLSFSSPAQSNQPKIPIPTEEIDPDSFDRGSFGRGSVPLVETGGQTPIFNIGGPRPSGQRINGPSSGTRGTHPPRGPSRGVDRGSGRGKGRLFVP